jgi:hypothetical protein
MTFSNFNICVSSQYILTDFSPLIMEYIFLFLSMLLYIYDVKY